MRKIFVLLFVVLLSNYTYGYDYPSLTHTFAARQLISAAKVMQNYNDILNGYIDGTKKINIAEVYMAGSLVIDDSRNYTGAAGTFTSLNNSDGNITNVGNIALDSISSDAGTSIAITLGSDAGDDLLVDTDGLVYEGDTNRVGIGTTAPVANLDILGPVTNTQTYLKMASNSSINGNRMFLFQKRGTSQYIFGQGYLDSSGYVTNGPFSRVCGLEFQDNLTSFIINDNATVSTTGNITYALCVENQGGQVGIGTTTPAYSLDVVGTNNISAGLIVDTNTLYVNAANNKVGINNSSPGSYNTNANNLVVGSGSGNEGISIVAGTSSDSAIYFADGTAGAAASVGSIVYDHGSDDMRFNANSINIITLDSAGYLGVGTTNVQQKLHLYETAGAVTAKIESTVNDAILNLVADSGQQSKLDFGDQDSLTVGRIWYSHTSNSMSFYTNSTEKMRLTSGGLLGIGTTSPVYSLDVVGTANISTDLRVDTNTLTVDSVNNRVGIGTTTPGSSLHLANSAPIFTLGTGANEDITVIFDGDGKDYHIAFDTTGDDLVLGSGSTPGASNYITLDFGGNVGIGTTTPATALDVVGTLTTDGLDNGDNNITNVGDIAIDSISADGGALFSINSQVNVQALISSSYDIWTTAAMKAATINITAAVAPPTPNSGGTLYVDSSDGDLKIKFSNGTIAVIANN